MNDPRLSVLMSLTPTDSLLRDIPLVEPFTGPLFWSAEMAWGWDRQYQWPEDRDRVRRPR